MSLFLQMYALFTTNMSLFLQIYAIFTTNMSLFLQIYALFMANMSLFLQIYALFMTSMSLFSRISRFSYIYCEIFCIEPSVDGSDVPLNSESITSTIGSEKFQTFIILAQYFEIMTKRKRNYQSTDISVFLIAC